MKYFILNSVTDIPKEYRNAMSYLYKALSKYGTVCSELTYEKLLKFWLSYCSSRFEHSCFVSPDEDEDFVESFAVWLADQE